MKRRRIEPRAQAKANIILPLLYDYLPPQHWRKARATCSSWHRSLNTLTQHISLQLMSQPSEGLSHDLDHAPTSCQMHAALAHLHWACVTTFHDIQQQYGLLLDRKQAMKLDAFIAVVKQQVRRLQKVAKATEVVAYSFVRQVHPDRVTRLNLKAPPHASAPFLRIACFPLWSLLVTMLKGLGNGLLQPQPQRLPPSFVLQCWQTYSHWKVKRRAPGIYTLFVHHPHTDKVLPVAWMLGHMLYWVGPRKEAVAEASEAQQEEYKQAIQSTATATWHNAADLYREFVFLDSEFRFLRAVQCIVHDWCSCICHNSSCKNF